MGGKEIQLNIDFSENHFGNNHEGAVIPSSSSSDPGTLVNSIGTYSNSHHSRIRRSSDDREKDLLLEAEHERQLQPLLFDEFWFSNPQEVHVDRLEILGERVEMPSSSGTVSVPGELEESMIASSKHSSPHRIQLDQSQGFKSNPHRYNYSDSHEGYLAASSGAECGATSVPLFSTTEDPDGWIIVNSQEPVSRHSPPTRRQEADKNLKDSTAGGMKGAKLGLDVFPSTMKLNEGLYIICLFKRRIIARDRLEHALYIIPVYKYHEIFPKINRDEALVCHGTEFPMGEEDKPVQQCKLHRQLIIADKLYVKFEMVVGQVFSVEEPCTRTVTVADIFSQSNERITAGFSVEVLIKCHGGRDKLYEDSVRVMLQLTGNTTTCLIFPVAYYEASNSPWPRGCPVTTMPDEDRDALRSCRVELLDNIGDPISLCDHLYQHRILDTDDMDYVMSLRTKKERNSHLLCTIQTKGNILDFVIKVMQSKRENQGAATILQKKRRNGADI